MSCFLHNPTEDPENVSLPIFLLCANDTCAMNYICCKAMCLTFHLPLLNTF